MLVYLPEPKQSAQLVENGETIILSICVKEKGRERVSKKRRRKALGIAQSSREIGTRNARGRGGKGRQKALGEGVGDSRISNAERGQEGARG